MISYSVYKYIHLVSIFVFIAATATAFSARPVPRLSKILAGIASLTILVGGMGMLARMGVKHLGPYPLWVALKMGIWLLLVATAPILAKRLKVSRGLVFTFWCMGLVATATYVVLFQEYFQ